MLTMKVDTSEAEALVRGMGEGLGDLTPVWPKVEQIVMDMERRQFETEGGVGGEQWEPLNEGYAEYKRREYGDKGILRRTDTLFRSLTRRGAPGHFFASGPNYVEVGTTVATGPWHQRGHLEPTPLPRRAVIPSQMPKEVGEAVADAVLAHVIKRARQALDRARRRR